jgi:hypothetical protein
VREEQAEHVIAINIAIIIKIAAVVIVIWASGIDISALR